MPSSTQSSSGARVPSNILKINQDISQKLDAATEDLLLAYQHDGYGGVNEWLRGWKELVDTILRVHQFGLLTDATVKKALDACTACLAPRIAVDDIFVEAGRLRSALDPDTTYDDWPHH